MLRAESEPGFSIVIPTRDTLAMTLRCCRSVLAQLPPDGEVIVVDDGSVDGTAEALRDVRVIRLQASGGFSVAANRGVAAARGAMVLLLNSDAVLEAGALDSIRRAFDRDAGLGVAGAQLFDPDGTPQWSGGPIPSLLWMLSVASGAGALRRRRREVVERDVDWVSGTAMAFRRDVWSAIGPLREDFRFYAQDLDFCVRARTAGWNVRIVADARVMHERGATIAPGLGYDPALLWNDLLHWSAGFHGERWERRARLSMRLGAAVRIGVRRLLELVLVGDARKAARAGTREYVRAWRALWTC
jgi:GT2 family glycosyltransferase